MGTRNLTCVVKDGEYKIAQYCQWDGYPSGQGETVAKFIMKRIQPDNGKAFAEKLNSIKYPTEAEIKKRWNSIGAVTDWVTFEQSAEFAKTWPHLLREFGAKILEYVYTDDNPEVSLATDFAADSLFCEYAYVIDLDHGLLEIYEGFNQKPLKKNARFFFLQKKDGQKSGDNTYYPIKVIKKIPFHKVTSNTMSELEDELNARQEKDDAE
jgi:hypothetical protein